MEAKKVIYLSGDTTKYEEFDRYDDALRLMGYNTLLPTHLPGGLTEQQEMWIRMAMIDSADAVIALSGWEKDNKADHEIGYCALTDKPFVLPPIDANVSPYWLREAVEEVFKA